MYVFLGTMLGLIFVFIYICVNLACIGYFLRVRRDLFNPIKHLVVPVLGVVAMIPAGLAVIGGLTIPILDIELPPYGNALQYTAPIVGIWMVIGIVLYFVLALAEPRGARAHGRRLRWRGAVSHGRGRLTRTRDDDGPAGAPARRDRAYSKMPSGQ